MWSTSEIVETTVTRFSQSRAKVQRGAPGGRQIPPLSKAITSNPPAAGRSVRSRVYGARNTLRNPVGVLDSASHGGSFPGSLPRTPVAHVRVDSGDAWFGPDDRFAVRPLYGLRASSLQEERPWQ